MGKSRKKHVHIPNTKMYGQWFMPNTEAIKQKDLLDKEQEEVRKRNGN